jgi:hypothetical protein
MKPIGLPMTIQKAKRIQVMGFKLTISARLQAIDRAGMNGTQGTRKRSISLDCWCTAIRAKAAGIHQLFKFLVSIFRTIGILLLTCHGDEDEQGQEEDSPPGGRVHTGSAPLQQGEDECAGDGEDEHSYGRHFTRSVLADDLLHPVKVGLQTASFVQNLGRRRKIQLAEAHSNSLQTDLVM